MADVLLQRPGLLVQDATIKQLAEQAAGDLQPPDVGAIAVLTSTLLGQLGDEGEDMAEDEPSGDEGLEALKLQARKPHLQGRFSGRLETKDDERKLADECRLLGPLLGGTGKRGEKCRLTLAKIVRGIASGDVRRYCEGRERLLRELKLLTEQHEQRMQQAQPGQQQEVNGMQSEALQAAWMTQDSSFTDQALAMLPGAIAVQVPNTGVTSPNGITESLAVLTQGQMPIPGGVLQTSLTSGHLVPVQAQQQPLMGAPEPDASQIMQPTAITSTVPLVVLPAEDQPPSDMLKAQAQMLKMHADLVASNSQSETSQPAKVQAHVKAQSLQVAAQSLEAQAEMQTLQAQAQVHAEAQAEAQAQAEELNAQAAAHAEAHATATVNASKLAHSSMGSSDSTDDQECNAQAMSLEAQMNAHAEAHSQAAVQAQNAAARAQAHGQAHVAASAQAQNLAVQAQNLSAQAHQLEAEASLVGSALDPHEDTKPLETQQHVRLQVQPCSLDPHKPGLQQALSGLHQQHPGLQQSFSGLQPQLPSLQHQSSGMQQQGLGVQPQQTLLPSQQSITNQNAILQLQQSSLQPQHQVTSMQQPPRVQGIQLQNGGLRLQPTALQQQVAGTQPQPSRLQQPPTLTQSQQPGLQPGLQSLASGMQFQQLNQVQPAVLQHQSSGTQLQPPGLQHQNPVNQFEQPGLHHQSPGLQLQQAGYPTTSLQQRHSGPEAAVDGIYRDGSMTKFTNPLRRTVSAQPKSSTPVHMGSSSKRCKFEELPEHQMQGFMPLHMPPFMCSSSSPIHLQTDAFGTMVAL
ncbi:hypothetical protein WJX74_010686 [Apatococcus lobatus]|uniref:Uncharacterized protein n=1 Tax=Apatococcus lobatus TaxID=904363 RepID=A0AAW1RCG5_9CHLO